MNLSRSLKNPEVFAGFQSTWILRVGILVDLVILIVSWVQGGPTGLSRRGLGNWIVVKGVLDLDC